MKTMKISTGSGGEGKVRRIRILSKTDIKIMMKKFPNCSGLYPDCPTVDCIINTFKNEKMIHPKCKICPMIFRYSSEKLEKLIKKAEADKSNAEVIK